MNRYPGFVLALLAAASTADAVVDMAPPCQLAGEWVRADSVQKVELFWNDGARWFGRLVSPQRLPFRWVSCS